MNNESMPPAWQGRSIAGPKLRLVEFTAFLEQTLELLQRDSRMLVQALQEAGLQADGGNLSFNLQGGNDSQGGDGQKKNVYPIAEEQFDEEMISVVSETHTVEIEQGVNIHA